MNYRYILLILMSIGWISFCQYQSHDVPKQVTTNAASRNDVVPSAGWLRVHGPVKRKLELIAQRMDNISKHPFVRAKSEPVLEKNGVEKMIEDVVNSTVDTWEYLPETANFTISKTSYRFLPIKNEISKSTNLHLMSDMVLIACLVGVFFFSSYLLQDKAAIYNPANPVAIVLFVMTLLFTAVLLIVDWLTIRYRMLSRVLKSRLSTIIRRFPYSGTRRMPERKLVEISGTH